jgi:putative ATPase
MIEGGEDPMFIIRRIIRMASEDIGLADPQGLQVAISAKEAYERLGSPEGELMIAQAVVYMALAPKSNALYTAWKGAQKISKESGHLSPPKVILNAPTKLMKDEGYGEGYIYDHDTKWSFSGQNYFPDDLCRRSFYQPKMVGFEKEMRKRVDFFENLRLASKSQQD